MRLPSPSPRGVEEFRLLYKEFFSLDLTPDEALFAASHYLHMFYILTYEPDILPLRSKEQPGREQAGREHSRPTRRPARNP